MGIPLGLRSRRGNQDAAAAAVFDPATLALSGWWRADYTGAPWAARASAGASLANGDLATNLSDPATGAAQNGFTPADFNGTTNNLSNATLDTTFYTSAAGTIIALVRADTAAAPTGSIYDDATLFRDANVFAGLSYTTSGFGGFGYDGAVYQSKYVAAATGAYHLVMMDWDSSNIGMTLNSAARVTQACGALTLGGDAVNVGGGYLLTHCFDGRILELMVAPTTLSAGDYANIKGYVNSRYALAL